jgi:hypothetical protein
LSVEQGVGSLQDFWKAGEAAGVGETVPVEETESLPGISLKVLRRAQLARSCLEVESIYF